MIYTDMTKKAMMLMYDAHKDQIDKGGVPYVFHPMAVASNMTNEVSTVVALLHDVVEDTDITLSDLSAFGDEVCLALSLLTRNSDDDYYDYIEKLSTNEIAREVKIADLKHNSDLSRLDTITEKDLKRQKKYLQCINYLESIEKNGNNQKLRKLAQSGGEMMQSIIVVIPYFGKFNNYFNFFFKSIEYKVRLIF